MALKPPFPWEALKAECLRTVCNQLMQSIGLRYSEVGRKDDMITFLTDVENRGLDKASQTLLESTKDEGKALRTASPAKRKAEETEDQQPNEEEENAEPYNTRYKGVKRVKVRAATPERTRTPRRKPASTSAAAGGAESASAGPSVKRGRGRPRKNAATEENGAASTAKTGGSASHVEGDAQAKPKRGRGKPKKADAPSAAATSAAASAASTTGKRPRGRPRKNPLPSGAAAPHSKGKEVFDGVLMEKRVVAPKNGAVAGSATANPPPEDDEGCDEDALGEDEDPLLLHGHVEDGASSIGGSNKENEPMFGAVYTPEQDALDADAPGEPDPNAEETVVTTETVQTIDITQSAVIMPTIPMALAAAASHSVPPPDLAQPTPGTSTPQERQVLQPL